MDRWTIYANPFAVNQPAVRSMLQNEKRIAKVNWRAVLTHEATSISSVVWESDGNITISGESHDGITTEALLTAEGTGRARVDCEVTMADGQVFHQRFSIHVEYGY